MNLKIFAFSLIILLILPPALASSPTPSTSVIEISDTPLEAASTNSTSLREFDVSSAATGAPLHQVLELEPTFNKSSAGSNGATSISLRGSPGEHTLVLLDGVQLNDLSSPGNGTDFSGLDFNGIGNIEVQPGPQIPSGHETSLGGVIALNSKPQFNPRHSITGSAFLLGGHDSTLIGGARVSKFFNRKSYFQVGFQSTQAEGPSAAIAPEGDLDGFKNQSLHLNGNLEASNQIDFKWTVRGVQTSSDLDRFGGPDGDDPNFSQTSRQWQGRWEAYFHPSSQSLDHRLGVGFSNLERSSANPADLKSTEQSYDFYQGKRLSVDTQHPVAIGSNNKITGDFFVTREEADGTSSYFPSTGEVIQTPFIANRTLYGAGLKHEWSPSGFKTTFSGHSTWNDSNTPLYSLKGNAEWIFSETIEGPIVGHFSGGHFEASPSLFQLNSSFGNPSLSSEKVLSFETGVSAPLYLIKSIRINANIFQSRYTDLVDFDFISSKYFNINSAITQGADLSLTYQSPEYAKFTIAYAFLQAKDLTQQKSLLRRPSHKLTVSPEIRLTRPLWFGMDLLWVGSREDQSANGPVSLTPYSTLSAHATYSVWNNGELLGRAENLFDSEYQLATGYNTPRRGLLIGMRLSL